MQNDAAAELKLGWSDFARNRYLPGGPHTHFLGTHDELMEHGQLYRRLVELQMGLSTAT